MTHLNDLTCRLHVLLKLAEAGRFFHEMHKKDPHAIFGCEPRIEGFLAFSERELVWTFGLDNPYELDPFTYEQVQDLTSLHAIAVSAIDLAFACDTLADTLHKNLKFRAAGVTAPHTFSAEEIEEMVKSLAS